jgi:hypothetical protein
MLSRALSFGMVLAAGLPVAAWAGGEAPQPSPRAAVEIGSVSVVLVFANGKLNAFVDRLEDNAPVHEAEVTVRRGGSSALSLAKVADGLFVAPYDPSGRSRDAFSIALRSPEGNGEQAAELVYATAVAEAVAPPPGFTATPLLWSGLGAAAALLAVAALQLLRSWRPRKPAGKAQAA